MKYLEQAKWIGSEERGTNTAVLDKYSICVKLCVVEGEKADYVFAARNKDNYILLK